MGTNSLIQDPNFHIRLAAKKRARGADVWAAQRRPNQIEPKEHWNIWLLMAGRGFGKTRVGAEQVRMWLQQGVKRIALVGATNSDIRDVMVEGESGVLACAKRYGIEGTYRASKRRVEFSTGARAYLYSADQPERLRGPQHEKAWGDEIGTWRYGEDALSNLDFGLRLGDNPQLVLTSTPRVVPIVKALMKRAKEGEPGVVLTRGSTWDNRSNLPASKLAEWQKKYGGTRLGRQELEGELLEDVEGALWSLALIDRDRLDQLPPEVHFVRVVVAVDPSVTNNEGSAETGIITAALGSDGHGYVIYDASLRGTPQEWATEAIAEYDRHSADHITVEVNNGGEMLSETLRTVRKTIPIHTVWASRGKVIRAEPVSALYEQGRVHHLTPLVRDEYGEWSRDDNLLELEDQMTTWVPGMPSPDRMDALVWALTDLMLGNYGEFEPDVPSDIYEELLAHGIG